MEIVLICIVATMTTCCLIKELYTAIINYQQEKKEAEIELDYLYEEAERQQRARNTQSLLDERERAQKYLAEKEKLQAMQDRKDAEIRNVRTNEYKLIQLRIK
jgi:hypothetical protein